MEEEKREIKEEKKKILFAAEDPYPKTAVCERNAQYAMWMLDNLGGSNSEISAVSLYFYNHLVSEEIVKEVSEIFHKIMIVEMHHLEIFGVLSLKLGEDPRLWTQANNRRKRYWTPACNNYPATFGGLVRNALDSERAAIEKYYSQILCIDDVKVCANLRRIILDEQIHEEILKGVICKYDL